MCIKGAVCVAGAAMVVGLMFYMDHEDRVREARIAWEQAKATTTASPIAKARLLRIELRKECILSSGIASEDSFRAVQNRLIDLWEEYREKNPPETPPKPKLAAEFGG